MSFVEFNVNGKKCTVTESIPRETTLNAYLRNYLALPGTKNMCLEGGCGACIVTVRAYRPTSGHVETFSVNSCLVLVFSCHGWDIITVEGLGNRHDGYDVIQKRISEFNGTQCGHCTPGWVMHLNSLRDKHLTMAELEKSFGSNTCRCTGFRPILDTIKSFAVDASPELYQRVQDIEDTPCNKKCKTKCLRKCSTISNYSDWSLVDMKIINESQIIAFDYGKKKYFKVFEEEHIFEVLSKYGVDSYMLIDGNTGKGVVENFEYSRVIIDINGVKSLKTYNFDQNLILGANISLEDCKMIFRDTAKSKPEFAYLSQMADHLELVAHIPVRKIGSLAGNLMIKYFMPAYQSDIFLLFAVVGGVVTIRDDKSNIKVLSMVDFLKTDMSGKLMISISLPPLSTTYTLKSYKIMPRHQNALAIVNAAFLVKINNVTNKVEDIFIVYGNISADFVYAYQTEAFLKGKNLFNNDTLQGAIQLLCKEINPVDDPPEQSPECRKKLAIGLFYKFVLSLCPAIIPSPIFRSGGYDLTRSLSHGTQTFQTHPELYPLSKPVTKLEAIIQSSGEAEYVNDMPPLPREVFGAFVLSTIHSGEVDEVYTDVLDVEGVLAIYTAKDIPGKNSFGFPGIQLQTEDEEILATKVLYYGQPVAVVVAVTESLATDVAKRVKVSYKNVSDKIPVLTIDEGKKDPKGYMTGTTIDPKGRGTDVQKVIKGVYEIEHQYHYYMEKITCIAIPKDKIMEIYDSTQWIDLCQIAVAQCLGIHESCVLVTVRRLGGGFGGKISRNVQASTACALVAYKMDRPCRFILPLQTNMTIAGRRLPSQCTYEVGVDNNGKIQYLDATIVEDDGCSHNENILEYTAGGFPNCYNTDYFSLKTGAVLTNLPSNTFARAPGTNEGISSIEHIMEHIAYEVKKDSTDVRLSNMRQEDNDLPKLIEELKQEADYNKRCKEIEVYNKANRWMKKAIQISVMLFPVEFYGNYSAVVSIYRGDGTVTVTTGGMEIGQGVNTKAAQVCAYELGIPLDYVTVLPSYSFTAANNVFTGSSIVSESVCYSIIKACDTLKKRLEPIKQTLTNPTWKELIKKAGDEQIDLVAEYMMTDKEPDLQSYSAFAVVILETQLDVLTGRYEICRADILEDAGLSANPNIDIGQVEGAYVQGLGYYTSEKLVFDKNTGRLLTNRSLNYHVPLALDIPADFRVILRSNSKNPKGVLGSKAVGEMGICTAHGINHVLRQCITESRNDSGYDPDVWINIDVPYDTQSILKALDVKYEEMILNKK